MHGGYYFNHVIISVRYWGEKRWQWEAEKTESNVFCKSNGKIQELRVNNSLKCILEKMKMDTDIWPLYLAIRWFQKTTFPQWQKSNM